MDAHELLAEIINTRIDILEQGMKAEEFLLKHSQELSKKYAGKYIAVVGDKVVAVSRSAVQAYKEAKKKYPKEEIGIFYMPTEEETVTLL